METGRRILRNIVAGKAAVGLSNTSNSKIVTILNPYYGTVTRNLDKEPS